MPELPTGTVTHLFTDLEGSTSLWERHPEAMKHVAAWHDGLLRQAVLGNGGTIVKATGDGFHAAFNDASDALRAALQAQRTLSQAALKEPAPIVPLHVRVRMGLHTCLAELREGDYFGPGVNRAARLMAAGRGGQVLLSLATEELIRDDLPQGIQLRDLGEHGLRDLGRAERIYQVVAPDLPADFPPLKTLDARPNNLTAPPTPLIGREREREAVKGLLIQDDLRLLTLLGPGGTGKTRLALQVAADLLDAFADGVYNVALGSLSAAALVLPTIAQVLGIREAGDIPPEEGLRRYLVQKRMLLLLDNFEHLLEAAPSIAQLLANAPNLKIIATSRAPLRVSGEREYPVLPLSLPDHDHPGPMADWLQYGAVRLFVDRARAVRPDFAITPGNAASIVEICRRLDGLPLAIELAAARVRLLSPAALLPRLESRLQLLTGGARDLPSRQQTLRGTIAWSHDLLDEAERTLFQRIAVFAGGAGLEAVEEVCSAAGGTEIEVFGGLESLVAQSLVQHDEGEEGGCRFVMLETIREYARERLRESGAESDIRGRHAGYYARWAEQAEPFLCGPEQVHWLGCVAAEHDNLRSALDWSLEEGGDGELGLRIAGALVYFWVKRGYLAEGRGWIDRALIAGVDPAARVRALIGAWLCAYFQGHLEAAEAYADECRAVALASGSRVGLGAALHMLGMVAQQRDDPDRAADLARESLSVLRTAGVAWLIARPIMLLGLVAHRQRDYEQAERYFGESLALCREIGDIWFVAILLTDLGVTALRQGDWKRAGAFYREALALYRQMDDRRGISWCLDGLAAVAFGRGEAAKAASLFGASDRIQQIVGSRVMNIISDTHEATIHATRDALGEQAFEVAWGEGQAMDLGEAISYAGFD